MWFLAVAGLVVAGICAGVGGVLAVLVRWLGQDWLKSLVLYGLLAASLLPLVFHYQWSRDRGQRVISELESYVENDVDPEHYAPSDVRKSKAVLAQFTWMGPAVLLGLYLLACWASRRWRWSGVFLPAVAFTVYFFFVNSVLYSLLGRYAYEAYWPLIDANKVSVWAFLLCGGAQIGLLLYAWVASTSKRPLIG